jgi:superfamily I DNA/RNA helicase
MPKKDFYIKDSELDDFQLRVINRKTDGNLIVKGCAGSGKSVLALWKVKQIQREEKGTYLFIVFTKVLRQYMLDGIRQIGIDESNVTYYHEWKYKLQCPSADYIIIDEAQDFSLEEIERFRSRAQKALLIYGDSAQQLYSSVKNKQVASIEEITLFTKFPEEKLVFNHRLPKTIARVAERISTVDDELEGRCRNAGTSKPKILQYRDIEEQLDAIVELISNRNMEDVGILFPTNREVEYAYDYFRDNHDIHVEAKYDNKNSEELNSVMNLNFTSKNPKIITYHSAKGLQFENVFLPECSCRYPNQQNALYVAVTRSYDGLYIMHSGNLSPFFDNVPKELYDTSLYSANTIRL